MEHGLSDTVQRYIIHLTNHDYTSADANWLLGKARGLVSDIGVVVRDSRVAKRHLEFDASIPQNISIDEVIHKLTTISPLSGYELIIEKKMDKLQALMRARELFNDEKYWGAHEVLEPVWKEARSEEKEVLNGIILIAAAFVHDEKNESSTCIAILRRAMNKLIQANGLYFGFNLDEIKKRVLQIIDSGRIERFTI
jgi:uncharacterized protein